MEIDLTQGAVPVVIVGLVEVAKKLGAPDRLLPLLAIALGMVAAVFVFPESTHQMSVYKGIVFGLVASGLWSQTRTMVRG